MSTTTRPAAPAWADPTATTYHDDEYIEDRGTNYQSAPIDQWTPECDGRETTVIIDGFRHDVGKDWADQIIIDGGCAGMPLNGYLDVADARRLAAALIKAADIIEGGESE